MPDPFPGMDPYLEDPSIREEFHHVFITECMYELSDRLPDRYIAKVGERAESISVNDEAAGQYVPGGPSYASGRRDSHRPTARQCHGGPAR